MHEVRRKCQSVCCNAHDEVHRDYVLFVTFTASNAAWVGRNAAMLHGVAMETAGNGGESARQRMCIKFCRFITYRRAPRACKLWRGTQRHSLLMWKNHFTGYYEESFLLHWMNFISDAPKLWLFISLFRDDKTLKRARAYMTRTISKAANKQEHYHGWYFYTDIIMQITVAKSAKPNMVWLSECSHGSIYCAEMDRDGQFRLLLILQHCRFPSLFCLSFDLIKICNWATVSYCSRHVFLYLLTKII